MTTFILADNQDITRLGLQTLCAAIPDAQSLRARRKKDLLSQLQEFSAAIVILDYTLVDFTGVDDLIVLHQRFPRVRWLLFSDELSNDFVRRIAAEDYAFSIVGKDSEVAEVDQAIRLALRGERFICHAAAEQLVSQPAHMMRPSAVLTPAEVDILREIALGRTTKEIAAARHSSFHTVNTHRKNIFRKLEVNTAYEAIRYALRAGLIDQSDYYI